MAGVALQGKQVVVTGASQVRRCPMHHLTYMLLYTDLRMTMAVSELYQLYGRLVRGGKQQ
jgi:hypothetical protein